MTDLGDEVDALLGLAGASSSSYGTVTVDVPAARWVEAATVLRDALAQDQLDLVTAVDEEAEGFDVVLRTWSTTRRCGLVLRTRVPRETPVVDSLHAVYGGAAWHERHVAEMLGVDFVGHPGLTRLVLDEAAPPHPLRKELLLDARQTTPWPGRKEPGESDTDAADVAAAAAPRRRRLLPPGVAP